MKKSLIILFVTFVSWILTTSFISSNKPKNKNVDQALCLELDGKVFVETTEDLENCKIELLCNQNTISTLFLKKRKNRFRFILKKNLFYSLKISKEGYYDKLIWINTEVPEVDPEEEIEEGLYRFKFSAKLDKIEENVKYMVDVKSLPVAIISYSKKQEQFVHDKKYSTEIKEFLLNNRLN